MNALHDRAFDSGLMTITTDFVIIYSKRLMESPRHDLFAAYNNKKISLPNRFAPQREFLEYHNAMVFQE